MMAASCLLFPSPYSFVFHFCFPNATSFQALYFFHVSGIIFFFTQLLILSHVLLLKGTEHCLFVHWLPFAAWNNSSAAVLGLYHSRAVPGARCCLSSLVYVQTGTASRAVHKPRDAHIALLCQRHRVLAASSPLVEYGAMMI